MRILIAVDKFKDSLSAADAGAAIARGLRGVMPEVEIDLCPLADGGEGTAVAITQALGGTIEYVDVVGPLPGMRVSAPIGWLEGGKLALIELATASGLSHLTPEQRDPTRTTTFGTGELMRFAADRGARQIILAIGGSATCDAGLGLAQAWGAVVRLMNGRTYTAADRKLTGGDVARVVSLQRPGSGGAMSNLLAHNDAALLDTRGVEFLVASDVSNPLYGPDGAAQVFGPQKGARPEQVAELDKGLAKLCERLDLQSYADLPGAGAAGGVGFAMMAFFNAKMRSGLEVVADAVKLDERVTTADLCITGEGKFDQQSLAGKATIGVARRCRDAGKPCVVLAGAVAPGLADAALAEGVTAAFSLNAGGLARADAMEQAAPLLEAAAAASLRLFIAGRAPARG